MLIRKLFIIASPYAYNVPNFTNGVLTDGLNYCNYFMSPTGGAYLPSEIVYLENPSKSELKRALALNPAYFSTLVFSGHGSMAKSTKNTFLDINSEEKISLNEIITHTRSERQFIITDSCRTYVEDSHLGFGGPIVPEPMNFPSHLSPQQATRLFQQAVNKSEKGVQILYSCAPGEKSKIESSGSHYTKSLLKSIRKWSLKIEPHSVLMGVGANKLSTNNIKLYNTIQNPQSIFTSNFPFAFRHGSELSY